MKVVIDILEDDYRKVIDGRASVTIMRDAIRNGTVIPKGCGDLIDANELYKDFEDRGMSYEGGLIKCAKPIIKADTEDI